MAEISSERWAAAQLAENSYWQNMDAAELLRIMAEKPAFLAQLGDETCRSLFDGKDVLEIGSGPAAISLASFYPEKARIKSLVKVEPLARISLETLPGKASWAKPLFDWAAQLSEEGEYLQSPGEKIQFNEAFDTVISYNVLDHVHEPWGILQNAHKALRRNGALLVGVDCMSVVGRLRFEHVTRRTLRGSVLVEAHPHTFLPGDVARMITGAGFALTASAGIPGAARRLFGSHFRPAFVAVKR